MHIAFQVVTTAVLSVSVYSSLQGKVGKSDRFPKAEAMSFPHSHSPPQKKIKRHCCNDDNDDNDDNDLENIRNIHASIAQPASISSETEHDQRHTTTNGDSFDGNPGGSVTSGNTLLLTPDKTGIDLNSNHWHTAVHNPKHKVDDAIHLHKNDDSRTGIVVEPGHGHVDHRNRLHRERPIRVEKILDDLQNSTDHLLDRCILIENNNIHVEKDDSHHKKAKLVSVDAARNEGVQRMPIKLASQSQDPILHVDDFERVHQLGYLQRLHKITSFSCQKLIDEEAAQYTSIYLTPHSLREAQRAAVALCRLVQQVVMNNLDNGFAIIRPPGHHAEVSLAGGYCLINNIAMAASYARHKLGLNKILIVDWDIHHGQGTQSIFLNDPTVLYFSVHRWEGGNFYPHGQQGGPHHVGIGAGVGRNVNVAWSCRGMGDNEYYAVWDYLLLPMVQEFQPDLILVSAGFDAANGDFGECHVSPECFGNLTRSLLHVMNGKNLVCALEGGYVRSILGQCVIEVVRALLCKSSSTTTDYITKKSRPEEFSAVSMPDLWNDIHPTAASNIQATLKAHHPYWKCLQDTEPNS